ncbi:MAG: hypothetical protein JWQ14_2778 [Adhaeribacter sp.]|nr:hypothetical protein [Adhaeribacter sp.]
MQINAIYLDLKIPIFRYFANKYIITKMSAATHKMAIIS